MNTPLIRQFFLLDLLFSTDSLYAKCKAMVNPPPMSANKCKERCAESDFDIWGYDKESFVCICCKH